MKKINYFFKKAYIYLSLPRFIKYMKLKQERNRYILTMRRVKTLRNSQDLHDKIMIINDRIDDLYEVNL